MYPSVRNPYWGASPPTYLSPRDDRYLIDKIVGADPQSSPEQTAPMSTSSFPVDYCDILCCIFRGVAATSLLRAWGPFQIHELG